MISTVGVVAGLQIVDKKCPKCGSAMYVKPAPCFMKKTRAGGWATVIKCVRCGHTEGYQKRKRRA